MPRTARSNQNGSVLLVTQSSTQPMFENNEDRDHFLAILNISKQKFKFDIFAYCLLSDYSFELLVRTPHMNISKIMSSLLITYTNYKKPQGKLFTQRFKSKPIASINDLEKMLESVNKPAQSPYNSYCVYHKLTTSPLSLLTTFDEACFECDVKSVAQQLTEFLHEHECTFDDVMANKSLRDECVFNLYQTTMCSLKEIGELFLGLDQSTISKIVKKSLQDT
jgi:putative transposase